MQNRTAFFKMCDLSLHDLKSWQNRGKSAGNSKLRSVNAALWSGVYELWQNIQCS